VGKERQACRSSTAHAARSSIMWTQCVTRRRHVLALYCNVHEKALPCSLAPHQGQLCLQRLPQLLLPRRRSRPLLAERSQALRCGRSRPTSVGWGCSRRRRLRRDSRSSSSRSSSAIAGRRRRRAAGAVQLCQGQKLGLLWRQWRLWRQSGLGCTRYCCRPCHRVGNSRRRKRRGERPALSTSAAFDSCRRGRDGAAVGGSIAIAATESCKRKGRHALCAALCGGEAVMLCVECALSSCPAGSSGGGGRGSGDISRCSCGARQR
jgi:hypothetical protein